MSTESSCGLVVDLSGQVAIVTGASQGLGRSMAVELARSGAQVACVARNVDKLQETVAAIEAAGGQAKAIACDVQDRSGIDELVDGVNEDWGRLDIMVNNGGLRVIRCCPA